jgi:hypothetical protein
MSHSNHARSLLLVTQNQAAQLRSPRRTWNGVVKSLEALAPRFAAAVRRLNA